MPNAWDEHPKLVERPTSPIVVSYTQMLAVNASDGTVLPPTPAPVKDAEGRWQGTIIYVIAIPFVALRVFETVGGTREAFHPMRGRIVEYASQVMGIFAPTYPPVRVLVHDAARDSTVAFDDLSEEQERAIDYCRSQGAVLEYFRLIMLATVSGRDDVALPLLFPDSRAR